MSLAASARFRYIQCQYLTIWRLDIRAKSRNHVHGGCEQCSDLLWMLGILYIVALPSLTSLAGLIGGIALPVTIAYPSFKWIMIKNPTKYSANWCPNWILGVLGMVLSILVVAGAIWTAVTWDRNSLLQASVSRVLTNLTTLGSRHCI